MGIESRLAAASMMRRLAWCGMNRLTSFAVKPWRERIVCAHSTNMRTATLKSSLPFILA